MHKVVGQDVGPSNTFLEGNPNSGQEGTEIPAAWLNGVQEEITGIPFVLEGAAPTSDNNQAGKAIKRALANAIASLDSKSISALANAITNLDNKSTTAITAARAEAAKQWCSDYTGNLDAITKPGIYRADTGATSLPAGASAGNFYLLHIQDPDHPNAPLVQQGWSHQASTPLQTWTRSKVSGGSWGAWVRYQEAFGASLSNLDNAPSSGVFSYGGSHMALVHKLDPNYEYQLILNTDNKLYTRYKANGSWTGNGQYLDWREIGSAPYLMAGSDRLPFLAIGETRIAACYRSFRIMLPAAGYYSFLKISTDRHGGAGWMNGEWNQRGNDTTLLDGQWQNYDDYLLIVYKRES